LLLVQEQIEIINLVHRILHKEVLCTTEEHQDMNEFLVNDFWIVLRINEFLFHEFDRTNQFDEKLYNRKRLAIFTKTRLCSLQCFTITCSLILLFVSLYFSLFIPYLYFSKMTSNDLDISFSRFVAIIYIKWSFLKW
jgi:hypothetical protein